MQSDFVLGYIGTDHLCSAPLPQTQPQPQPQNQSTPPNEINRQNYDGSFRDTSSGAIDLFQRLSLKPTGLPSEISIHIKDQDNRSAAANQSMAHVTSAISLITLPDEINDIKPKAVSQIKEKVLANEAGNTLYKSPSLISLISQSSDLDGVSLLLGDEKSEFDIIDYI